MALPVSLNSRIWSAKGVEPGVGDETYQAGEQPIAPYDNWAMWSVTRDLYNVTDELGDHNDHHEVGGDDEIDLQNLQVNGVAALNGDPDTGEFRLVDPASSSSVTRIDVDNNLVKQWPAFDIRPELRKGAKAGNDIVRANADETKLYDYAAGSTGKFHHAKFADEAAHADYADNADMVDGQHASEFIDADDAVTWTNTHTFNRTVNADITGNAATADHADSADHAVNADYATDAGDADTVDGYHAADLIDEAKSEGEWQTITTHEHSTIGQEFNWDFTSPTTYDRYRLRIYHESHKDSGPKAFFWFRLGQNDAVENLSSRRYEWRERDINNNKYTNHRSHGFTVGGCWPGHISMTTLIISCPEAVNSPRGHYPVVGTETKEASREVPRQFMNGHWKRNVGWINAFQLDCPFDTSTGRIVLDGQNFG